MKEEKNTIAMRNYKITLAGLWMVYYLVPTLFILNASRSLGDSLTINHVSLGFIYSGIVIIPPPLCVIMAKTGTKRFRKIMWASIIAGTMLALYFLLMMIKLSSIHP